MLGLKFGDRQSVTFKSSVLTAKNSDLSLTVEINREISSVFEISLSEENFFESTTKLKDVQTGIPVLVYGGLECDMKLQKLTLLPYRELCLRYDFLPEDCDL